MIPRCRLYGPVLGKRGKFVYSFPTGDILYSFVTVIANNTVCIIFHTAPAEKNESAILLSLPVLPHHQQDDHCNDYDCHNQNNLFDGEPACKEQDEERGDHESEGGEHDHRYPLPPEDPGDDGGSVQAYSGDPCDRDAGDGTVLLNRRIFLHFLPDIIDPAFHPVRRQGQAVADFEDGDNHSDGKCGHDEEDSGGVESQGQAEWRCGRLEDGCREDEAQDA